MGGLGPGDFPPAYFYAMRKDSRYRSKISQLTNVTLSNLKIALGFEEAQNVDRPGIAGKLQQLLVRKAVYDLCLLVAQELTAQLAKLVRDFFHGFDGLVVVFHNVILRFL